jgi:HSP20 family molecular chaperone IbpA
MLSFIRPNTYTPFPAFSRFSFPKEGSPFVVQNDTHWLVKTYLPDVYEEDFKASISNSKLALNWKDTKKIKHMGRIYESSESYEKFLEVPEGITDEDFEVYWDGPIAIVAITKPLPKTIDEKPNKELVDGSQLMKFKVPENGDHKLDVKVENNRLIVSFEASGDSETDNGFTKFHSTVKKSFMLPEGVDASNITSNIENGELTISYQKALPAPEEPVAESIETVEENKGEQKNEKMEEEESFTVEDVAPEMED